ncbi:winged helix DNA-binding domain-containing protein [Nocardia sp. NPDC055002]
MAAREHSVSIGTAEVIGFRLHANTLLSRRPIGDLLDVAGACAVQNSPPGSALLALAARVDGVTGDHVDHLVAQDKALLQTWCMRGSPFFFPTADAPVFTTGVLPTTEAARLRLIGGVGPALDTLGIGLDEVVERTVAQIGPVLSQRATAIGELGAELASRIADTLTAAQRTAWQSPGPYGANQPLGEAVVHFCLRILTLRGIVCLAPRTGNTAPFVLLAEWLDGPLPDTDPAADRATLLRRYLRCYGPSSRGEFATWLGVRAGDVDPWWDTVADELTPVDYDGRRRWIHTEDLEELRSAHEASGVRLLPPGDPYTQTRDRDTIVDPKYRRAVWKTVGAPGVVLADGAVAGIWRPRKSGRTLTLTVTPFQSMSSRLRALLREEAAPVATLRGATEVDVRFDDPAS